MAQSVQLPRELFIPRVQETEQNRCDILLDQAIVEMTKEDPPVPLLKMNGNLTSACTNLQLGVKPPDDAKQIEIILGSGTIEGQKTSGGNKAFNIGYPLANLKTGNYSILIKYAAYNAEQKKIIEFSVP